MHWFERIHLKGDNFRMVFVLTHCSYYATSEEKTLCVDAYSSLEQAYSAMKAGFEEEIASSELSEEEFTECEISPSPSNDSHEGLFIKCEAKLEYPEHEFYWRVTECEVSGDADDD